ncbi:MAG: ATP-grasp domain-containing protein [candidate division KSB1 bacterium]|nr:ATP-grasp domain-containing protein [candidate division KSB1 bacterium]MDZ7305408.1 ATP-grasp domain-containing protein [candidate division KSB1 bacterium]MDZ7314480.1 ATP-grasp domain-containing protein [candidate division KSB1 bacterium]
MTSDSIAPSKGRILIAYNEPKREQRGRDIDFVSEAGVLDEVHAVRDELSVLGYEVVITPVQKSVPAFIDRVVRLRPQAIFNLVEGWQGESQFEMHFPSVYELLGIPYTGASPWTLATALNKWYTKSLLRQAKLPAPAGMLCSEVPGRCYLRYPVIVKPASEDASLGVDFDAVVTNLADLRRRVAWVVQTYHQPALVEEYIDGRELNVAVLGDQFPEALPISEITFGMVPEHLPKICTYSAKWMPGSQDDRWMEPLCPAPMDEELARKVQNLAIDAFRLLGCRDYARIDMRLANDNQPYILEVNPNPDISPDAGLARSARASGRTYTQLIGEVISWALQRGTNESYERRHSASAFGGPAFTSRRSARNRADFAADESLSRNGSAVRVGAD